MKKTLRQPDLYPLRLDAVVQEGKKVRDRLIGPIGYGAKAELFVGERLLCGLLDKIAHILFEKPDDVAGERHGEFLDRIIGVLRSMSKVTMRCGVMLTGRRTLLYDGREPG